MDDEVVIFCQTQIVGSGLVLDEDLVFIQMVERKVKKPESALTRNIFFLTTAACTSLWARKKSDFVKVSTGLLLIIPIASSLVLWFNRKRKLEARKTSIIHLLSEFRNLSRIHSEVTEFLKVYSISIKSSNSQKNVEDSIFDLSKCFCDIQVRITKAMLKAISKTHTGLPDVSLDLTEFRRATSLPLVHNSMKGCLHNVNLVEGQVVLLRSHLLTSMFLVSSSKGNQEVFLKILDQVIPQFIDLLKNSINEIKQILNKTRFPPSPPSLSFAKIENIFTQKKLISVPRMRKHVIKINDGICCTMIKLRKLLDSMENLDDESQMMVVQDVVSTLTKELYGCYLSATDLEKLLELLNRTLKNEGFNCDKPTFSVEENSNSTTYLSPKIASDTEDPLDDSDYQVFATEACDDENETHAVRFYKRFMNNDTDWLAELRQSDAFQRRQTKFHTGLPITSTPFEGNFKENEAFKTAIEMSPSVSGMQSNTSPPVPPPLPGVFSKDISGIMVAPSKPKNPTEGNGSILLDSLKEALDKMEPREVDEFE